MKLCCDWNCKNEKCDNYDNPDNEYMNIAEFCPAVWDKIRLFVYDKTRHESCASLPKEYEAFDIITSIHNADDYVEAVDEVELDYVSTDEGSSDLSPEGFFAVLDLVVDAALCGVDYEENIRQLVRL